MNHTKLRANRALVGIFITLAAATAAAQAPTDSVVLVHAGRLLDRPGQQPRDGIVHERQAAP